MIDGRPLRSILFAPANQPDLIRKMPRADADISAVDLEDGTPPKEKTSARPLAMDAAASLRDEGWNGHLFIRSNHPSDIHFLGDIALACEGSFDGVIVPKVSELQDVDRLSKVLDIIDPTEENIPYIVLGIESGSGVIHLEDLLEATPRIVAVYFGAEDFATSIGAVRTVDNVEVLYARSRVALHARTHGISAFDQGVVEFKDDDRFTRESKQARALGFTGKICVHPRQSKLANELFLPTDQEIEEATQLLDAYDEALSQGIATPAIHGRMIDGPLVVRAKNILAMAKQSEAVQREK